MSEITIVEVSPRDGLQNEAEILSTDAKVDLITRLVDAGARRIEAVSFAHPKLVPTMADAEAVMERVPRRTGVSYAGLILNRKGLDRAVGTGVDEINVVVCVSDTFSGRNQNVTADEAMRMAADVVAAAPIEGSLRHDHAGDLVRLSVRGRGRPGARAEFARRSADSGARGAVPRRHHRGGRAGTGRRPDGANPRRARRHGDSAPRLRFHFHNTRNTGFANAYAAVTEGVDVLDASAGGIGGCPFAPKPPATSPPTTSSTCSSGWGTGPGSTSRRSCPRRRSSASTSATRCPPCCRGRACSPDPVERKSWWPNTSHRIAEIVGTSPNGVDDAIRNAVTRANQTLRDIDWFE